MMILMILMIITLHLHLDHEDDLHCLIIALIECSGIALSVLSCPLP